MDKLPRDAFGFPDRELTNDAHRVTALGPMFLIAVLCMVAATRPVHAEPAHFWLSTSTSPTNGPIAPEVPGTVGATQYVYIWARPETFTGGGFNRMQNISLNLVSSDPVVDFLDDQIKVYNTLDYRFEYVRDSLSDPAVTSEETQQSVLDDNYPDSILGIKGFSFDRTYHSGFGGFCSTFYDCTYSQNGTPTWLIARVGFRPVRNGATNFFLQIGANGMNHFYESTAQTSVLFGKDAGAAVTYEADIERNMTLPTDTPDLVLQVGVPTLAGDYNRNNNVDAADYVLWRKTRGQTGSGLLADGTGPTGAPDGVVDTRDYTFWKSRFGTSSGGAAPQTADSSSAVPEPRTIALVVSGLIPLIRRRSAARTRSSTES